MQKFMEMQGVETGDLARLPASQIEDILSKTNFQEIPVTTQLVLLEELKVKDLRRIEITNCVKLDDRLLEGLFQFRSLVSLKLYGCLQLQLSFALLAALSDRCRALQDLVLSDLPQPRRIARAGVASLKPLELPNLLTLFIFRCPALSEIRLSAPALQRLTITDCPQLRVLDSYAPCLDRLDVEQCMCLQERELAHFVHGCRSRTLAFLNVELFGLPADVVRSLFGGHLIRSLLSPGGEAHWPIAKRIASIAEDGPALTNSVLVTCLEEDVGWRAAEYTFRLLTDDDDRVRQVLDFEEPSVWALATNAARVSVRQANDEMAKALIRVGIYHDLDTASAIATVAVMDTNLGNAILDAAPHIGWDSAKAVAVIAHEDASLAEPLLSLGRKKNWDTAKNLINVAKDDPELGKQIVSMGKDGNWEAVDTVGQVAQTNLELARSIIQIGSSVSWPMAISLARFATNDGSMSQLNLFNCGLSSKDANSIANIVKLNTSLKVFVVFGNDFQDSGGSVIVSALQAGSNLSEIWLWDCGFGVATATAFGNALRSNGILETACFRGLAFGEEGIKAIAGGLAANSKLAELRFQQCGFTANATAAFEQSLASNATLRLLEIADEPLEDSGGICFAKGLSSNQGLEELYLYSCGLGLGAAKAFGESLASNTVLRILDFAGAVFTDGGGAAVIKSLLANKSLKELRMWRCGLGDETLAAAREMLPANKTLETLTLSTEGFSHEGIELLSIGARSSSLKDLRLMRAGMSAETMDLFNGQDGVRFI